MTPRERVRTTLSHGVPDRIPIDFGATRGTGIAAEAYIRLRSHLGLPVDRPYLFDAVQQLAYPDEDVLDRFQVDLIDGGRAFRLQREQCQVWKLDEGQETLMPGFFRIEQAEDGACFIKAPQREIRVGRKDKGSSYFSQVHWVYGHLPELPRDLAPADIEENIYGIPIHPWDLDLESAEGYARLVSGIAGLYERTQRAIALTVGCQFLEMGQYLRGMETFLCDLYVDEAGVRRLFDQLLELYLKRLHKVLAGVGRYVATLRFVDDLGTQKAPLISPEKYRRLIQPYHRAMWDYVHCHSECAVTLHSCGSVYEFIPDFIEAGLDALNPVQTSCANMEPERLMREFGRSLVFWGGGCDTREILPRARPQAVREHVQQRVRQFGEKGGMVFSQIHNVLPDAPAENIVAMLDAAQACANIT